MKIFLVGAGVGAEQFLTAYARRIIQNAQLVIATSRLYSKLHHLNKNTVCKDIGEFVSLIQSSREQVDNICILASGDVGFYSISKMLGRSFAGDSVEFVSGISSLQALTAILGTSYDDVKTVSVHGRNSLVVPHVCYNKKVFVLTGGQCKAQDVITQLCDSGLCDVTVTVGENLSEDDQRVLTQTAGELTGVQFGNLAVMLIENANAVNHNQLLKDDDFIRGKSPMTKQAIRILSVSALDIQPADIVADIGAGTGSVAIAMARHAHEGMVYAIEKEEHAIELIKQNIEKHSAYNIKVISGFAPSQFDELPKIDKAFIGGSGGNLQEIITALLENNKAVKIVVNAITIETLGEAVAAFKLHGISTDLSCVNISNSHNIGNYHMMKAENPIYIISGGGL